MYFIITRHPYKLSTILLTFDVGNIFVGLLLQLTIFPYLQTVGLHIF